MKKLSILVFLMSLSAVAADPVEGRITVNPLGSDAVGIQITGAAANAIMSTMDASTIDTRASARGTTVKRGNGIFCKKDRSGTRCSALIDSLGRVEADREIRARKY